MKTAFSNIVFGLLTFSLTLPPQVFAQSNANVANSTEFAHLRRDLGKALTKMNSQGARFSLSPDFSNNLPLSEDSVLGAFDASGTKNIYELIHDKSGAEVGLHLTMKLIDQNPTVQVEMMDVSDKHLVEFETPIRTEIPVDLNHGDVFKNQLNEAAQTLSSKALQQLNNPFAKSSKNHRLQKVFAAMTEKLIPSAQALDLGMLMVPLIVGGMALTISFTVVWLMCKEIGIAFKNTQMAGRALVWRKNAAFVFGGVIGIILLDGIISWVSSPNR